MYRYQAHYDAHPEWRLPVDLLSCAAFGSGGTRRGATHDTSIHTGTSQSYEKRGFFQVLSVPQALPADLCPPGRARSLHSYPDSHRRRRR